MLWLVMKDCGNSWVCLFAVLGRVRHVFIHGIVYVSDKTTRVETVYAGAAVCNETSLNLEPIDGQFV